MFLLPVTCPLCHEPGPAPCAACADLLVPAEHVRAPAGLASLTAVASYVAGGGKLVRQAKFANQRSSLSWFAHELAERLQHVAPSLDCITWVPSLPANRRARGYDTGAILARHLGKELHVPVRRLLRRSAGRSQLAAGSRQRRLAGPVLQPTFAAKLLQYPNVLIVDDVSTTGASMAAAARALRLASAQCVRGAVAVHTPLG